MEFKYTYPIFVDNIHITTCTASLIASSNGNYGGQWEVLKFSFQIDGVPKNYIYGELSRYAYKILMEEHKQHVDVLAARALAKEVA